MSSDALNQEVYILKTFKALANDLRVQKVTLELVDSIVKAIESKIAEGAGYIADGSNMKTVTLAHMRSAASTVLSGGDDKNSIEENAVENANEAVDLYVQHKSTKANPISRSNRAVIMLSISRVEHSLKEMYRGFMRVQELAVVFLTSVLDRLSSNICGLAVRAAQDRGAKTLQPLDVYQGILNDTYGLHSVIGFAVKGPEAAAFAIETIAKMQKCTGKKVKVVCDRKAARA